MNSGYGFFKKSSFRDESVVRKKEGCGVCRLYKDCISPKMEASGDGEKGLFFLAEAPGAKEDRRGTQLVGDMGQKLRRILRKFDFDLDVDGRKMNAVNCRPPGNETPTEIQIDSCRPRVMKEIEAFKPKVLLLMGKPALQSVVGHRFKKGLGAMEKWAGWAIPDRDLNCWVVPTFHPSYVARMNSDVLDRLFEEHIERAIRLLGRSLPEVHDEREDIKILTRYEDIMPYLEEILARQRLIAFDVEATGLKPHAPKHKIYSCAIAWGPRECVSFPYLNRLRPILTKIYTSPRIYKMAHHVQFEDLWIRHFHGLPVFPWGWDSMLAAHVIDNRRGITSLKFQVAINFGLYDYDSHLSDLLEGIDSKDGNSFNRIHEIEQHDLLLYNGMDSIFNFKLALRQMLYFSIIDPLVYMREGRIPKAREFDFDRVSGLDEKALRSARMRKQVKERARRRY